MPNALRTGTWIERSFAREGSLACERSGVYVFLGQPIPADNNARLAGYPDATEADLLDRWQNEGGGQTFFAWGWVEPIIGICPNAGLHRADPLLPHVTAYSYIPPGQGPTFGR